MLAGRPGVVITVDKIFRRSRYEDWRGESFLQTCSGDSIDFALRIINLRGVFGLGQVLQLYFCCLLSLLLCCELAPEDDLGRTLYDAVKNRGQRPILNDCRHKWLTSNFSS